MKSSRQAPGPASPVMAFELKKIFGMNGKNEAVPFSREERGGLTLWRFNLSAPDTRTYFTTRGGGVSSAPYDSLNLGFHVGDDPEKVKGNRALLAGVLGLDPARITSPRQRHTPVVAPLLEKSDAGQGAFREESSFDPCDGLITALKNTPVLLHFADCVPVVLTGGAPAGPVVGVIHAGRRGIFGGVIRNGVSVMADRFDAAQEELVAAIGPAIAPCCYEVDEETAFEFMGKHGEEAALVREGKYFLDLGKTAVKELESAGLSSDKIHLLDLCTSCEDGFFSYRRDGITGRHGAIAWIE